jgi:hypothetical protein
MNSMRCDGIELTRATTSATKRRGLVRKLDFVGYRAKYIAMVINALDQSFCRAGRLQIGK